MRKYIYSIVALVVGILLGGGGVWLSSHATRRGGDPGEIGYGQLLRYANMEIREDKFHCEGDSARDVASVVGSILQSNERNVRNRMFLQCSGMDCVLSVSDCKPWQPDGCGSRVLAFKLNKANEIDPGTFECYDIP